MKTIRNWWWCGGCAAVLCCCAMVQGASAATKTAVHRRVAEVSPWERAERGREALEGIPEETRTRADYMLAMDGFRAVYHESPGDMHAPDSVNAVAELLEEQGRSLHDGKSLKAAVGQYEFLRTQYPGSSLRVAALLAEAQIFENDLHDGGAARERYEQLIKQYPRSGQAEEARAGLTSLEQGTGSREEGRGKREEGAGNSRQRSGGMMEGSGKGQAVGSASSLVSSIPKSDAGGSGGASSFAPMPVTRTAVAPVAQDRNIVGGASGVRGGVKTERSGRPTSEDRDPSTGSGQAVGHPSGVEEGAGGVERRGTSAPMDVEDDAQGTEVQSATPLHVAKATRRGQLARVTGIRHWSTPNYTRVAIDLGDDVTYEAARVPNPDRIYFDLHGTKLAEELVGKSFAVTDDGFLKKIRAAQFSNDMTRVVLDVNDVTEYSAFLLPNPYRLIIDIHGGSKDQGSVIAAAASAPAPAAAVVMQSTKMRPVPNTVAVKTASSVDVAELSAQPGRVEATSRPTSQPISAVVKEQGTGKREEGKGKRDQGAGDPEPHEEAALGSTAVGSATTGSAKRTKKGRADVPGMPARAAVPTADGETSLVRALGLKIGRIVIDAGHGGHDSGTLGADGIEEKDVVLDVALRLGKLLHDRLGAEIIYTRSDDTFIPLETRTAIANKAQADLFLSIHANSSSDESARGVETYYLNFTTAPDALETAARENAVSDQSIHELSDMVKKITLKDKIAESREFASDVQQSLYGGLQKGNAGLKDRGVKKAPFVVLIGANMPSILAEISFVTNRRDARQLLEPEYRERVAESLYKGVSKYAGGLSGARAPVERASTR